MLTLLSPHLGFYGGVERHVFDLARGLRARGTRIALAYADPGGDEPERYARAFDDVAPVERAGALFRDAHTVYTHKIFDRDLLARIPHRTPLFAAIHDHDTTCVRSHRYLPLNASPCTRPPGVACVAYGCALVRTRQGSAPFTLRSPFALRRDTLALAERARLVASSEFLRDGLLAAGVPSGRIDVVHPVPPDDETPVRPLPHEPRLAFVGQLIRGKGVDLLLRAMATLADDVTLSIAGEGSARVDLEALCGELRIASRVTFLGALPPERVVSVYDDARVIVVPSRWPEPFGMIGVEAMRRGRIVVGARHGGIPEWLVEGETGFAFRPGDAPDLARAVAEALATASPEAMGRAARARATSRFAHEQMLERIANVLATRAHVLSHSARGRMRVAR